jgi:hypothetical protein
MMINFSFRKEQKKKKAEKLAHADLILDQVRKVLSSNEQGLILMAK